MVHRADTLETLAAAVGLPRDRFAATVERFNLLARHGHDEDFGRGESADDRYYGDPTVSPAPCLGPIEEGPFYALYATGNVAANAFGKVYPGPGATIGSAVTFGSLAVKHLVASRTAAV